MNFLNCVTVIGACKELKAWILSGLERTSPLWITYLRRHSTTQLFIYSPTQSVRPTSLMYDRYPYGSFAEYSEECIRGNRRGHLINACVVVISRGNKERNPFGFEPKIYSSPSCEVRKVKRHSEANIIKYTWLLTLDS